MKVLVTDGAGFNRSNFIYYPPRTHLAWQIVNPDKLTYTGNLENLAAVQDNARYTFVHGDVADRELANNLFALEKFDPVAHLAAEFRVGSSILDASALIETNVKGTQVLPLAACFSLLHLDQVLIGKGY